MLRGLAIVAATVVVIDEGKVDGLFSGGRNVFEGDHASTGSSPATAAARRVKPVVRGLADRLQDPAPGAVVAAAVGSGSGGLVRGSAVIFETHGVMVMMMMVVVSQVVAAGGMIMSTSSPVGR
jgi:hypothetical protein